MNKPAILSNPEAFVVVPVEPVGYGVYEGCDIVGFVPGAKEDEYKLPGDKRERAPLFARPDPTALADIVAYCAALEARLANAEADRDLLQDVLDTRPAINAGLPESYIRWSQSIYSGDVVRAAFSPRKGNGNG